MNSPGQIGKQTVKFRSPNFFFQSCADSHSFCEPIYSEDTNLFRFMKTPMAVVVGSPVSVVLVMHHHHASSTTLNALGAPTSRRPVQSQKARLAPLKTMRDPNPIEPSRTQKI